MQIVTTAIVFGPGRFVPIGTELDLKPWDTLELINAGTARPKDPAELQRTCDGWPPRLPAVAGQLN